MEMMWRGWVWGGDEIETGRLNEKRGEEFKG